MTELLERSPSAELFELEIEPEAEAPSEAEELRRPDVERVGGAWYAAHVFALLDATDLPESIRAVLESWARGNDRNVRTRRPFCVDRDYGSDWFYSFDWFYRRNVAPAWWVDASRAWGLAHGVDERGRPVAGGRRDVP